MYFNNKIYFEASSNILNTKYFNVMYLKYEIQITF